MWLFVRLFQILFCSFLFIFIFIFLFISVSLQKERMGEEENKRAKMTVCEQNRKPEPNTRTKKRDNIMLIQMNLENKSFRVVQERVRIFNIPHLSTLINLF